MELTTLESLHVRPGADRFGQNRMLIWGMIPLSIKVSARDTGGSLLVFQHEGMGPGGPPRHVHHGQDEWFYAIEGQFAMEIGERRFTLRPGDSLLAPRGIPHAWACVSDVGALMTAVTPAGTFEEFILETTRHAALPTPAEVAAAFERHNMTVLGPPLMAGH